MTLKKVTGDFESRFSFNTAIASIMELLNAIPEDFKKDDASNSKKFCLNESIIIILKTLNPIAPHISEFLWNHFDRDKVRYARLTNLDDTNYVSLIIRNGADDEFAIKLSAGASFIVNGASSTAVQNVFDANGAAISSITFADLYSITGTADTANCDLEFFVASI